MTEPNEEPTLSDLLYHLYHSKHHTEWAPRDGRFVYQCMEAAARLEARVAELEETLDKVYKMVWKKHTEDYYSGSSSPQGQGRFRSGCE